MNQRSSKSRAGFALILVISVLALILLYLVAAQGSVSTSQGLKEIQFSRLDRLEAEARLLSEMTHGTGNEIRSQTLATGHTTTQTVTVQRTMLVNHDPLLGELPGISGKPGDALVTFSWSGSAGSQRVERFLVNTHRQRSGAIMLARADGIRPISLAQSITTATLTTDSLPTAPSGMAPSTTQSATTTTTSTEINLIPAAVTTETKGNVPQAQSTMVITSFTAPTIQIPTTNTSTTSLSLETTATTGQMMRPLQITSATLNLQTTGTLGNSSTSESLTISPTH